MNIKKKSRGRPLNGWLRILIFREIQMTKRIGFILAILLLLSVCNCGKKGPLLLEPGLIPTAVENIQVSQVGDTLKLMWSFPQNFTDKKKTPFEVENIRKIHIYYSNKEITGGKFRKKASLLKKLTPQDLTKAPEPLTDSSLLKKSSSKKTTTAEIKNFSYFITVPFKIGDLENKDHFFGVQYYYHKKKSPMSEIAYIHTMVPVKPVNGIEITQENKLIKITWKRPTLDELGNPIANITGYNIYKKIEPEQTVEDQENENPVESEPPVFEKINKDKVLTEYYEDTDSGINGKYSYYISAVISNQIETSPSTIKSLEITDIYPPEVPANLVCFRASDHLFLTWKPSMDNDLSHYRVYRRSGADAEMKIIADDIKTTSYKDKDIQKKKTYFYSVTALDQKGNESEHSNEVKEEFK